MVGRGRRVGDLAGRDITRTSAFASTALWLAHKRASVSVASAANDLGRPHRHRCTHEFDAGEAEAPAPQVKPEHAGDPGVETTQRARRKEQ